MKDKNIFPEQTRLEKLGKQTFIANVVIIIFSLVLAMAAFLFLVWATVKLLQYMGVL